MKKKKMKTVKIEIQLAEIEDLGECVGVLCPDCSEFVFVRTGDIKALMICNQNKTMDGVV